MPPRSSPTLLLAALAALLAVHACIMLGGTAGKAAVVFCAVALLIFAPIAVLAWLGSLTDLDVRQRKQRRQQAMRRHEADLWQKTLMELQPHSMAQPAAAADHAPGAGHWAPFTRVAAAAFRSARSARSLAPLRRSVLGLLLAIGSTVGLMGCESIPDWEPIPNWAAVQPGMGKRDLVALVGAPQQIQSNGSVELWQYCRDGIFGRNARYYMTVLVDQEQVREVRPYPVWSHAGCEDFFRAGS